MRVVMIGSGNVATAMVEALLGKCDIVQVYSRTPAHASALAARAGCPAVSFLNDLVADADVYVVAVHDDAIADIVSQVPDNGALWFHTSGTKSLDTLTPYRRRCGVMWPMQSFSKQLPATFTTAHVFIEGSSPSVTERLRRFAEMLTPHVHEATSEVRRKMHVAAVFACNFTNHLWALADDILRRENLPFDTLLPLIKTTVAKLDTLPPRLSQTGPAARGDQEVIDSHLSMLDGTEREIYSLLSKSIQQYSDKYDQ